MKWIACGYCDTDYPVSDADTIEEWTEANAACEECGKVQWGGDERKPTYMIELNETDKNEFKLALNVALGHYMALLDRGILENDEIKAQITRLQVLVCEIENSKRKE